MRTLIAVALLALVGCKKDPVEQYASYRAYCFSCAVEAHDDAGRTFRDTLTGHVTENGDTVAASVKWNLMVLEGDPLYIRACSTLPDSVNFPVVVTVENNWVNGKETRRAEGMDCAEIDAVFHQ